MGKKKIKNDELLEIEDTPVVEETIEVEEPVIETEPKTEIFKEPEPKIEIKEEHKPVQTTQDDTITFKPVWKFQKGEKVFTKKHPNQSFRIVKHYGWTTDLKNIYYIKSNKTETQDFVLEEELSYTLVF